MIFSGCASIVSQWRLKSSHVLSLVLGQSRHLISRIDPRAQSACVAASSALYPVLNFLGILKYSFSASSCCCCCCCSCCGTGPAAPVPPPHSPQPKSAVYPQFLPPTPAGNSVPARVDGKFPAHSGSRASPLRVPPPWVYIDLLILGSWPQACGGS